MKRRALSFLLLIVWSAAFLHCLADKGAAHTHFTDSQHATHHHHHSPHEDLPDADHTGHSHREGDVDCCEIGALVRPANVELGDGFESQAVAYVILPAFVRATFVAETCARPPTTGVFTPHSRVPQELIQSLRAPNSPPALA